MFAFKFDVCIEKKRFHWFDWIGVFEPARFEIGTSILLQNLVEFPL
jgi:hypothetical protein